MTASDEGEASQGPLAREEVERRVREGYALLDAVSRRVSRRFAGKVPLEDLKAHGADALLDIAERYDPTRAKFSTFATMKLQWAMLDGVRRDRRGRLGARAAAMLASARYSATHESSAADGVRPEGELPTEEACQTRLRTLLDGHAAALAIGLVAAEIAGAGAGAHTESAEEHFERAELGAAVRSAVRELPDPRQRALVERHYFGGEQFDAIARELGISKSWASRIHAQAIEALSTRLRSAGG